MSLPVGGAIVRSPSCHTVRLSVRGSDVAGRHVVEDTPSGRALLIADDDGPAAPDSVAVLCRQVRGRTRSRKPTKSRNAKISFPDLQSRRIEKKVAESRGIRLSCC